MNTQENSNSGSKNNKLLGAGLVSAVAASLCCINPVLALISGASGMASAFSWMEPLRPYLIGMSFLVLGFAWYQKFKPRTEEEVACACETDDKPSFWQSKKFLGIVTVFAIVMMAFPLYADTFYPSNNQQEGIVVNSQNLQTATFEIKGMTCKGCEAHIEHEVNKLTGILEVEASYENASATVQFDESKVSLEEIKKAIDSTGYKVQRQQ